MGKAADDRCAPVFVGVDTHSDAHVAVALDGTSRRLGELAIANDRSGYACLWDWALRFGVLVAAGVEGTGSYGAGISRFLRARGANVVALNRMRRDPRRQEYVAKRTAEGKSKKEAMRCLKRYIARDLPTPRAFQVVIRSSVIPQSEYPLGSGRHT